MSKEEDTNPKTSSTEQEPTNNSYDLFSDKTLQNAYKALTPAQREKYRQVGEHMYGNLNFKEKEVMNNVAPPFEEAAVYIGEGLKSGLHPSYLEENEKAVLQEVYGEKWFEKWGYTKEDVEEDPES